MHLSQEPSFRQVILICLHIAINSNWEMWQKSVFLVTIVYIENRLWQMRMGMGSNTYFWKIDVRANS